MILPSTIRKLQEKGDSVIRVTIPAHVVTMNGRSYPQPERKDYFASASGAAGHIANANPAQWGVKGCVIRAETIPASALDIFGCEA